MNVTRRALLSAALGAGQVALLDQLGLPVLRARRAHAAAGGPTKLLTIYVPGGWIPMHLWCPLDAAEVERLIPAPMDQSGEAVYFNAATLKNLDGSGDADLGGAYPRLRVPRLWDEAALAAGMQDPRTKNPLTGAPTSPHGWSWVQNKLWQNCSVVHGVDQGTAAHDSAQVSAMCGAPGAQYRAPAIHSVVANAFFQRYADARPLPCVSIAQGPAPNPFNLPQAASPTQMDSVESLQYTLADTVPEAWLDLRERTSRPQVSFDGQPLDAIATTALDEYAMRQARALRGKSTRGDDQFFAQLHDGYQRVSKVLARDVVSVLAKTKGVEFNPNPFWSFSGAFGVDIGRGNKSDSGGTWNEPFELALKLLKSDLTSAISLYCPGSGGFYFDTHGDGHATHFTYLRAVFDVIGRLLGEMKATPAPGGGGTLLDDTLVLIFSEFARTWPKSGACDHWPSTSVAFVGGGITPNRMIGGYDTEGKTGSFLGKPVAIVEEGGNKSMRAPRSADVIDTALRILGINDFFIPGGHGEIVGVRA
jgi:hypothetical protein